MNDVAYAGDSVATGTRNFADQAIYYAQIWGPRILTALIILLIAQPIKRMINAARMRGPQIWA